MKLTDEEAIDNVNPFVQHEMSLPGTVRQSGDFNDFGQRTVVTPGGGEGKGGAIFILLVGTTILLLYSLKR